MADELLKENFRGSMTTDDATKLLTKLTKTNADCDKGKLNKTPTESYDSNGKRTDGVSTNEPVKKKQKRPRDDKTNDPTGSLSSAVSITPIASLQSSVTTSLSNTGLYHNFK